MFCKHSKRDFGTVQYGSEKVVRNSFFLVPREEIGTQVLLMARAVLFLRLSAKNGCELADFAFLHLMKCINPLDEVGKAVEYMYAGRSTDGKVNHTLES